MQLSKRLMACCRYVAPGDRVADVGCDHGFLSIYLLKNKIASAVIASDIGGGPLKSAMTNADKYGVADNIRFFISDGVQSIPREFDCMICAGMGGDTMISILDAAPWLQNKQYKLVLQCQTRVHLLRQYLSQKGWCIQDESTVRDGKFVYTVICAVWDPSAPRLTAGQCYFSPTLLNHPTEETAEFYQRLLFSLRRAIKGRGENADPWMVEALAELEPLEVKHTWLKELTTWQP